MRFLKTVGLAEATELLNRHTALPRERELVSLSEALGRYLYEDIRARDDVPYYDRSTVDGYAVVSSSTQGASDAVPVVLRSDGSVAIGTLAAQRVTADSAVYVPTGGMVPSGADAMVMVEYSQKLDDWILIQKPAPSGANLVRRGEDIARDTTVLRKGHCLKAQDLGILAELNVLDVPVLCKPSVFIISTGDEFAGADDPLGDGKIRDINTHTISALAEEAGFFVKGTALVPDDPSAIEAAVRTGTDQADLILLSGGSSAGERDYTRQVIEMLGGQILFHGIRIKPGKPTIGAALFGRPVIGLPGHPASCIMIFKTLVIDYFEKTTGCSVIRRRIKARTSVNFPSVPGRVTCQFLTLEETASEILCRPYYSNSALISQLTGAQGFVMIPEEAEGLDEGTIVDVILL